MTQINNFDEFRKLYQENPNYCWSLPREDLVKVLMDAAYQFGRLVVEIIDNKEQSPYTLKPGYIGPGEAIEYPKGAKAHITDEGVEILTKAYENLERYHTHRKERCPHKPGYIGPGTRNFCIGQHAGERLKETEAYKTQGRGAYVGGKAMLDDGQWPKEVVDRLGREPGGIRIGRGADKPMTGESGDEVIEYTSEDIERMYETVMKLEPGEGLILNPEMLPEQDLNKLRGMLTEKPIPLIGKTIFQKNDTNGHLIPEEYYQEKFSRCDTEPFEDKIKKTDFLFNKEDWE